MSENSRKTLEEMSNHELLEELVRMERNKEKLSLALCVLGIVLTAALIIALAILVPRAIASLESVEQSMDAVEQSMSVVEQLAGEAEVSLEQLNKIDFENLNQGISDFAKIVKSLSNLFGR